MPMYIAKQIHLGRVVAVQEFEAPDDETAKAEGVNIDPLKLARDRKTVYWIEVKRKDE